MTRTAPAQRVGGGAGLAKLRETARRYGLSQAEYDLLFAVVVAAERRRQAQSILNRNPNYNIGHGDAPDLRKVISEATNDLNTALAALEQHLIGTATTAQDGAERGADGT